MLKDEHSNLVTGCYSDRSNFVTFYEQNWECLFKYINRILPDANEVADVVQESFIAFWSFQLKDRDIEQPKPYLFTIARNIAFKKFKSNLRKKEFMDRVIESYEDCDELTEQQIHANFLSEKIDIEIEKLPIKMREIFLLSREGNLSYKEIAEQLSISDLTVKKQISNALKHLRTNIDIEYASYLMLLLFFSN